jgi:hypothetical protein
MSEPVFKDASSSGVCDIGGTGPLLARVRPAQSEPIPNLSRETPFDRLTFPGDGGR